MQQQAAYGFSAQPAMNIQQNQYRNMQMPVARPNSVDNTVGSSQMRSQQQVQQQPMMAQASNVYSSGGNGMNHDLKYMQGSQQQQQQAVANFARNMQANKNFQSAGYNMQQPQQQQNIAPQGQKYVSQQQQPRQPLLYQGHMPNAMPQPVQRPITGHGAMNQQQSLSYPQPIQRPNHSNAAAGMNYATQQKPQHASMGQSGGGGPKALSAEEREKQKQDAVRQTQSFFASSKPSGGADGPEGQKE
jgi:hypothetical protein